MSTGVLMFKEHKETRPAAAHFALSSPELAPEPAAHILTRWVPQHRLHCDPAHNHPALIQEH